MDFPESRDMFVGDLTQETDYREFCEIEEVYRIQIERVRRSHLISLGIGEHFPARSQK